MNDEVITSCSHPCTNTRSNPESSGFDLLFYIHNITLLKCPTMSNNLQGYGLGAPLGHPSNDTSFAPSRVNTSSTIPPGPNSSNHDQAPAPANELPVAEGPQPPAHQNERVPIVHAPDKRTAYFEQARSELPSSGSRLQQGPTPLEASRHEGPVKTVDPSNQWANERPDVIPETIVYTAREPIQQPNDQYMAKQDIYTHVTRPAVPTIHHPSSGQGQYPATMDPDQTTHVDGSQSTLDPASIHRTVHIPNSHPSNQTSVVPATEAARSPDHALPTAPDIHPEKQAQALNSGDVHPVTVAREVEKAKAGQRELKGKKPKGTVVEGIEDDRLWMLMRRFDVQVTHTLIMTTTNTHPDEPDLRRSTLKAVPYNRDVLQSNVERLYATLGIIVIRLISEVSRLRSWAPEERRRTAYFCSVYFTAWVFGMAIPTLIGFIIVLTVSEEARWKCFPPVLPPPGTPPSATDPLNKKGDQSLLGGVDDPIKHRSKSEQVEEQAWEFRQL